MFFPSVTARPDDVSRSAENVWTVNRMPLKIPAFKKNFMSLAGAKNDYRGGFN
jgi:hypothetical protein